jgi:transcriptional regulator with PAS, ATPase and Fis domain
METIYFSIAMITAGISAALGSVSFLVGLNTRENRSYLLFGCMGWLMVLFILTPPVGFITMDVAPYETTMLIKRIFIFLYYAVFPWFIYSYTSRPGKRIPRAITVFTIASYFVMFNTSTPFERPLWTHFAIVIFGINVAYGIAGITWMFRTGEKREAKWLSVAIAFFGVLYISALSNHIHFAITGGNLFGMQRYFPIHLNSLALMFIVGLRLQHVAMQRFGLEKMIVAQRTRWKSLLENMPLLMLEVQRDGRIIAANNFAATHLGLTSSEEMVGKNWFDLFSSTQEMSKARATFAEGSHAATLPAIKGYFNFSAKEPILVNWLSFVGSNVPGGPGNIVLIGLDVTSQESALVEIAKLRLEIEKESLTKFYSTSSNSSTAIIGSSKAIGYTLQKAQQVAATNATVLLEGETGVGKELFADYIFSHSLRKDKPFIKVNCSALPSELIEDELFGHEKGAFTSAAASRTGRFELADGGTILLDEIGELPLSLQPKLLRVLQQGEFERIGGQKTLHVDVRIIASTNRDLNKEVAEGRFRSDLLYRLNVFPISIPALRNRKEDLDVLVSHFIQRKSEKYKKSFQQITKADLIRLHEYPWPGNIRELRNLIERSIIQSEGDTLKLQWLHHGLPESHSASMEEMEKEHIIRILNESQWKINGVNGAAERLDMNPNTLRSRMKKLNITRDMRPLGSIGRL